MYIYVGLENGRPFFWHGKGSFFSSLFCLSPSGSFSWAFTCHHVKFWWLHAWCSSAVRLKGCLILNHSFMQHPPLSVTPGDECEHIEILPSGWMFTVPLPCRCHSARSGVRAEHTLRSMVFLERTCLQLKLGIISSAYTSCFFFLLQQLHSSTSGMSANIWQLSQICQV